MPDRIARTYTARELESQAEAYLRRVFGSAIPVPIDVDYLVERSEGLDLDYYPKLGANHGVLGGVWRDVEAGDLFIFIDADLADNDSRVGRARYRSTVAEELAHVHLHRSLIQSVKCADDFQALHRHPQWGEIERNAKRFAAAILMPAATLGNEAARAYEQIVRRPEILPKLLDDDASERWLDPVKKWLCEDLALRFEVSEQTMSHRLSEWPTKIDERLKRSLVAGADSLL